jgi:hypothetical protein
MKAAGFAVVALVALSGAAAALAVGAVPLAARVAPRLGDLPAVQGWIAGPTNKFDPQHPPVLLCPGRTPGFANLLASQVAFGTFATPMLNGLVTTTIAFGTVREARSWFSRELRRGVVACVIHEEQADSASMGSPQGVRGKLRLVRSATPSLRVGMQSYELTATFRPSSGDREMHVWALVRYGRVVFVVHGFWFPQGVPFSPARLLAKVIARTPDH